MATKTWIQTSGNLWSTAANWGGTIPHTTDDVKFTSSSTANCTMDGLSDFAGTVTISSGYSGTITQSTGINFSGTTFAQAGGTFTCHSAATFTSTTFSVTGGTFNQGGAFVSTTFGCTGTGIYVGSSATMSTTAVTHSNTAALTATSGVWSLAGSWTKNNTPTFTHNSGTITITAASTFSPAVTLNLVTINSAASITISSGTTAPFGASPSTTVGSQTLTIAGVVTWTGAWTAVGNLTVTGTLTGTSTPTLDVDRSITASGATITNAIGTITISGSAGGSNITDTTGALSGSTWVITKTGSVAVNVISGTAISLGANPVSTVTTNTLTVQSTATVSWTGAWTITGTLSVSGVLTGTSTPTIDINQSLTTTSATITNAIGTVTFSGGVAATYTDTADKLSGTTFVINKAGATLAVAASTTMRLGANPTSTLTTSTLTVTGTLTWSGAWTHTGSLTVTGTLTGTSTPTLSLDRSLTTSGATITNAIGTVTCTGSSTFTYTDTTDAMSASTFIINKSGAASVTSAASTTLRLGASPSSTMGSGVITATGVINATGTWTINGGGLTVGAAGSVTGISTLVIVDGSLTNSNGGTIPTGCNVTMTITALGPRNFRGGGMTYGILRVICSFATSLVITGSNTFTTIRDNDGTVAHTLQFTAGTTQTVGSFLVAGVLGAVVTLSSTVGASAFTLTKTGGGDVRCDFLAISDSTVDTSPDWYAGSRSSNGGGNTNWLFEDPPGYGGSSRGRGREFARVRQAS